MKIEEQWECWNPMRDNNEGMYRGGEGDDTCGHGLSRRSLICKNHLRVELERRSGDEINKKKHTINTITRDHCNQDPSHTQKPIYFILSVFLRNTACSSSAPTSNQSPRHSNHGQDSGSCRRVWTKQQGRGCCCIYTSAVTL